MVQVVFWIAIGVVAYTFLGYGIVIGFLVKLKDLLSKKINQTEKEFLPDVTLVVPCYNEADIIKDKVLNSLGLEYPNEKLKIFFITDGSNDNFKEVLSEFPQVKLLHDDRRAGKTAAENRAMKFVSSPIVVFTDANTVLNVKAIKNIVRHFSDEKVGCVSGEKRVLVEEEDSASSAGEGMYWKYESFLKKMDSKLYSAVGAAGELVAFRSDLYRDLPEDTILDDFMQSLLIASDGYRIVYEPEAYAMETGSDSTGEELKRKIRISAGGWQSMKRLFFKITPFNHPVLFFQYLSHRVLRWTITPFLLVLIFVVNFFLLSQGVIYQLLMFSQLFFYAAALLGYFLESRKIRIKILFVPFYFCMMNYAVVAGLLRFMKGSQKSTWEKAKRKS
ncbi:glycosyltransferase family 2 protein [Cyclobacterium qasimii]|uniref:Glycosyl transferase n=2 Tax=Cyclobacterium qasimii TaxID=1350429 RepID=A0A512C8K9_9BACT|nr:glycosyltransferase family 2 protein [Cyclobacterium qasimii]EPR71373.1 putative transmembrane glycosyltransferase [Cyclobacterium qasimii M12-11B]GEO20546.1 glycosyl transferase [Cyclobacterium qasimii]